ncbi:B12-binding domain-containing radical SAM protein [Thermogladius sp. 4427co]|uniref:B12-binding domain-containing radical SAM protein n=1 Tax=Thermogladius sp. 4427co TaxID=3450718 RepID=UPI003F79195F
MRVLVVDALARSEGARYSTYDVVGSGPRVVAGIVESIGIPVRLVTYENVVNNKVRVGRFDLVLISAMSSDLGAVVKLSNYLKKLNSNIFILVGGPISFSWKKLLEEAADVDAVIVGEAEIPLPIFLREIGEKGLGNIDFERIPAIAFRTPNKTIKLTSHHIHASVDDIVRYKHWSRVDLTYHPVKIYRYYVEVVRGCSNFYRPILRKLGCIKCFLCRSRELEKRIQCPANIPAGCGFCSVPYMFGPARSIPIDYISREVEELVENGARRIVLSAPDFLDYGRDWLVRSVLTDPCEPQPNTDAIEGLLSSLSDIKVFRDGEGVLMIENIKACLVNDEIARVLGKYLRGTTIHIGLETGDYEFNRDVLGKPIGLDHVVKAARLLREAGLRPYVYLMHSLPLASDRVYVETIKGVRELAKVGVEKITLYKYMPLPGTAFEPLGPPRLDDRLKSLVLELKKLVDEFNLASKKNLLNEEVEVYLLYSNGRFYGYPVKHGPVVFVKGVKSDKYSGCRAIVKITDVRERYVIGVLSRIVGC